ncbi:DUF6602 domain-containing protein [Paraburkholderia sp. J63]|uniref:DUF6602 domain-containing protein n=1 Tax=Paraburkholderia sp. J63 TaxID=2805434 RepID=UPI002ABD259A|nr:DUF6602 domain-containing protein [Paraburkholderia sp. J63]
MANKIFDALFRERVDVFRAAFSATSTEIFYDSSKARLFHAGEYGIYRESIVREFLKFIIPQSLDISTGFILSTMDDVSSQCDIIGFDPRMTPLYQEGDRQRFFPLESVYCVGEVKSTLSRNAFSQALNKLAAVKALGERIVAPGVARPDQLHFNPTDDARQLFSSFLICQKFDFDTSNIENEIDRFYDPCVAHRHKHNVILSMEDGLLTYIDQGGTTVPYPRFVTQDLKNLFSFPKHDEYYHFKIFSSLLFLLTTNKTPWHPEFSKYVHIADDAATGRIQK